ncbi:SDR family NAD(P)-dependent oxidoreductase [Endozoicomonas numazuensis]|uniref:SDR family NAD(P)-dependent oxidoreductase n=1 Tax=Endozoicomonas numazuensis TaxID=1137799 RepID=UPI00068DB4E1|nr:SDR family NAD(P)-dependent oxidoreductase [Endozoicomonas numazuensis]
MNFRKNKKKPSKKITMAKPVDLKGKHMIVTGAAPGSLGYETAKQLLLWGASVVITTRNDTQDVAATLKQELGLPADKVSLGSHTLDLANTASVQNFVSWYTANYGSRLDALINNAGIHLDLLSKWKEPRLTEDGHEMHWRINHLGTAHLTDELLPLLRKTGREHGEARIVNVVSQLHSRGNNTLLFNPDRPYESWQAYGLSKLATMHFSNELHRRFNATDNIKSYSLHPALKSGATSNIAKRGLEEQPFLKWLLTISSRLGEAFMASTREGAQTQLHCATDKEAEGGHYYVNCLIAPVSSDANDKEAARRLWEQTNRWLRDSGLQGKEVSNKEGEHVLEV